MNIPAKYEVFGEGLNLLEKLQQAIEAFKKEPTAHPNDPVPEIGPFVEKAVNAVTVIGNTEDKAIAAFCTQTLTHLRHVSFDFKIDNEAYPHAPVLAGPYPYAPTLKALEKTCDLIEIVIGLADQTITPQIIRSEEEIRKSHKKTVRNVIADPLGCYLDYRARLEKYGSAAPFPEFADVADILLLAMENDPEVLSLSKNNPVIGGLRARAHKQLCAAGCPDESAPSFGYAKMIDAIERGVEFFDIVQRSLYPEKSPPLYHTHRYEYYMHYLTAQIPSHIFFPTTYNLGVTDLMKVRGVPIGFAGVNTQIERVDGFYQTSYEFFMHDVNHSRRMQQFAQEEADRRGMNDLAYYNETNAYARDVVLPSFSALPEDSAEVAARKRLKKMILFEILHEEALPADPAVLKRTLKRAPNSLTPFEKIEGDNVIHIMEPGATVLNYVFRKLAHTFYDEPSDRRDYIVPNAARSRAEIAAAAKELSAELDLGLTDQLIEAYLATDQGLPDDFRKDVEKDIKRRNLEGLSYS